MPTSNGSGTQKRKSDARTNSLLGQLDESRRQFGSGAGNRTERILDRLARHRFADVDSLIRFHEALLYIRAFPQTTAAFLKADQALSTFETRVESLHSSGEDLTPFDYIEYSGIAGTTLSGTFSYDIDRWLADRHRSNVEVDWERSKNSERLSLALPRLLPLLYEDSLVEANVPYREWLRAATGPKSSLEWLIRRFAQLKLANRDAAALFDSLGLRVRWSLGNSPASRSRNMLRPRKVFCHTSPLIRRSEVSLDNEFGSRPIALIRLSGARGGAMQDMLRATTTVRYRELYGITHGDPESVVRADVGRGIEIFLWGLPPDRRLPLRAYHAGFTLKNGVPINYIEGITICERMEVGFNTFYTFRDGESAWVYAKVLKLLNQIVGVTCISIDTYQLGLHNEEAIESGAFWFYRKLGFRPTRADLAKLTAAEERKVAANPRYRTPASVLRRLSRGTLVYEAPGSHSGDWDRFAIRNIGFAVQRRMCREFDGDPERIRSASTTEVARALGLEGRPRSAIARRALENLSLVLGLIPDLADWTPAEKKQVEQLMRAKVAIREDRYARLLQAHQKLRAAIIRLGEGPDEHP